MNISIPIISRGLLSFTISPFEINFGICDFQGLCPFPLSCWHKLFQISLFLLSVSRICRYTPSFNSETGNLCILSFFLDQSCQGFVLVPNAAITNKQPQMQQLKTTEMYSLNSGSCKPEMSLTGLKSRYQQGWLLLEAPGSNYSLPLPVSSGYWHS